MMMTIIIRLKKQQQRKIPISLLTTFMPAPIFVNGELQDSIKKKEEMKTHLTRLRDISFRFFLPENEMKHEQYVTLKMKSLKMCRSESC